MPEVGRDALVVVVGRHRVPGVPVVARGVVDQHLSRADALLECREGALQGIDVAQVARLEVHGRTELARQGCSLLGIEVHEAHARALPGEGADDVGTDARRAARDEDGSALKGGVVGEVHERVLR